MPARRTSGWVTLELPLLLTYTFGGGGQRNPRIYGRDLVLQTAFTVHVGRKLLGEFGGTLSRLRVYALLEQNLTPNRRRADLPIDRFNPMAFYGITIPIGAGGEP